jgi:uncharacterized RmlC-like cupin family protein
MASLTTQWLHHWRGIVSMRVGRTQISMHFSTWSSSGSAGQHLIVRVSDPQAEHQAAASSK